MATARTERSWRDARSLAVNCSILYTKTTIAERLRHVADGGLTAVEFWWPFATAAPDAKEIDAFAREIEAAGVTLVGLNLFAGDMPAGDRGVLSWPGREEELLASTRVAGLLGERLGVRRFNVLYGNRIEGVDPLEQDAAADRQLREIAMMLRPVDGVAMIEAVSGVPTYPIKTAAEAAAVVDRASSGGAHPNIGILLDLYHLAANGEDVGLAIEAYGARAAHVQLADLPGRGLPGTGTLPLAQYVARLRELGYGGWIALEHVDAAENPVGRITERLRKDLA